MIIEAENGNIHLKMVPFATRICLEIQIDPILGPQAFLDENNISELISALEKAKTELTKQKNERT